MLLGNGSTTYLVIRRIHEQAKSRAGRNVPSTLSLLEHSQDRHFGQHSGHPSQATTVVLVLLVVLCRKIFVYLSSSLLEAGRTKQVSSDCTDVMDGVWRPQTSARPRLWTTSMMHVIPPLSATVPSLRAFATDGGFRPDFATELSEMNLTPRRRQAQCVVQSGELYPRIVCADPASRRYLLLTSSVTA